MLKRLLILDGVVAVCRFQDDGSMIDAAGMLPEEVMKQLAQFAQWYRRMVAGNTDLFSLFSQMAGWTPAHGWIVRGQEMTVCSLANIICLVENKTASINQIMRELEEASHE